MTTQPMDQSPGTRELISLCIINPNLKVAILFEFPNKARLKFMTLTNIHLPQTFLIADPTLYKLHLASWNEFDEPLDVFVRDRSEWETWNAWRISRNDFNRKFIFSLINFYPENDIWLFGGVYQVLSRKNKNHARSYEVELLDEGKPYIGRLKIELKRRGRARVVKFEQYYEKLVISEILSSPYSGEAFCGYDKIDVTFPMLESVISIQNAGWKAALENIKGVYLITDTSNGKRYVGSAYGMDGIWSRWKTYVETGHGHNKQLRQLIKDSGIKYARNNFRFALLEHQSMKADDEFIIERENYWKKVLLTRSEYGYNDN